MSIYQIPSQRLRNYVVFFSDLFTFESACDHDIDQYRKSYRHWLPMREQEKGAAF